MTRDNTIPEFVRTKEVVEEVLKDETRARNDDTYLIWCVLRRMGYKIFIDFKDFQSMPKFETIRRARQRIQNNERKYLPTEPDVRRRRAKRERVYREYMSGIDRKGFI